MTEHKLRLLAAIVENSDDAIVSKSLDGTILSWNAGAEKMFGYKPEEILGQPITRLLPPERMQEESQILQRLWRGDTIGHFETVRVTKDGRHLNVSLSISPLRDNAGNLVGAAKIVRDITPRKQAEEALRASEEKFRAAFQGAAVGIGRARLSDARWIDANDALCRMVGYTEEEMRRTPWPKMTHPDDVDLDLIPFRRMAAGELDSYSIEKRFIHKDGHLVWARLTLSLARDAAGRPDYEIAVVEDITDRKRAEQSLRQSESRYRTLFESIDEGFCVIEVIFDKNNNPVNYRFLEVNPAFEKHTFLQNVRDKTVLEVIPELDPQWFTLYGRVAKSGEPTRFLDHVKATNQWFEGYAFRVGEAAEHRVAILFTDITERKRSERALIQSEKLAASGRLAATIAHEVNNPLAAALNAVFLISSDPAVKPETKKYAMLADEQLRRAAHITEQTLGFYRQNSKGGPVAVPTLVEEIIGLYASKLQYRNIAVHQKYRCGRPCDNCDGCFAVNAGEMRQIISNLLANAMDAVRDDGKLYIRASRTTSANGRGQKLHLTIADDGSGIRVEHLKRIFEPFFTTKEAYGTGLGLWVTQELVRKHNGTIKVRSRSGHGTVFRLSFPAMQTDEGEQRNPAGRMMLNDNPLFTKRAS